MATGSPPPWNSPESANSALPFSPSGVEGRAGLLALVDIIRSGPSQAQLHVRCKLCMKTMSGQSVRMAAHFAQKSGYHVSTCSNSTPNTLALGTKFIEQLEDKRRSTNSSKKRARENTKEAAVMLHPKTCNTTPLRLKEGGGSGETTAVDKAYLRFLIATGQSFGVGESVYFKELLEAVRACPEWTPRSRRPLCTTDLDAEYEEINLDSKNVLLARNGLERGKTLQIDRCKDKDGRQRINVLESIDGKERFVDGFNIPMGSLADLLGKYIDNSVDLVLCDKMSADALTSIESKFPRVTILKCCGQGADLLLKDLCKLGVFAPVITRVAAIANFVKADRTTLAIYHEKTELSLITPNPSRFATHLISAMRMLKVKAALKLFANDTRTAGYIDGAPLPGAGGRGGRDAVQAGRNAVDAINAGDAMEGEFWFELEFFVELMLPVYELLRMGDGASPCMSKFFHHFLKLPDRWDEICQQHALASKAPDGAGWKSPTVLERLVIVKEKGANRLRDIWNPVMSAAFALDPEYRSVDLHEINGGQILLDLHTVYERLLINHGGDPKAAIAAACEESDGGPAARAGGQFHLFRTGRWKGASLLGYAKRMSPADWWEQYGIGMPDLAKVAIRVTSKAHALAGRERNRSLYGDDSGGSHRLVGQERARKLRFVRANLRLQKQDYPKKALVAWDPDSVESDGYMGSGSELDDDFSDS